MAKYGPLLNEIATGCLEKAKEVAAAAEQAADTAARGKLLKCPVCMEEGAVSRALWCGHLYCEGCVGMVIQQGKCGLCKKSKGVAESNEDELAKKGAMKVFMV